MIVFEELTDIRERLLHADWHHIWAFGHLVEYVEYKAPERGVAAEQVEPDHRASGAHTPTVGLLTKTTATVSGFRCLKCGYEITANYNVAKNTGLRYVSRRQHRLRSSPTLRGADAPVDVRVNGGIWILNGDGYRSTADR